MIDFLISMISVKPKVYNAIGRDRINFNTETISFNEVGGNMMIESRRVNGVAVMPDKNGGPSDMVAADIYNYIYCNKDRFASWIEVEQDVG